MYGQCVGVCVQIVGMHGCMGLAWRQTCLSGVHVNDHVAIGWTCEWVLCEQCWVSVGACGAGGGLAGTST